MKIIVGLGNPGEKYEGTRHNTGRSTLEYFRKKHDFPEWKFDKKLNAQVSEGKLGKEKVFLACPDTFMNNSGKTAGQLVKSKKAMNDFLVVYDDLDMPFGHLRVSYGRSSGGHNGLESVIRALKTKDFPRLRVGVSPATPSGKIRKPSGEKKVLDFLLGTFSKSEQGALPKIFKKAGEVTETFVSDGYQISMNRFN